MNKILYSFFTCLICLHLNAQETRELVLYRPSSIIDLKTTAGIELVHGNWLIKEAQIKPVQFQAPGPSNTDALKLYPTGKTIIKKVTTRKDFFAGKNFNTNNKKIGEKM